MKPRHEPLASPARRTPPPQQQEPPGEETRMTPEPLDDDPNYQPAAKLKDKVALITGGDSGIGRATAIAFAKEGADVAIVYLEEDNDANRTEAAISRYGRRCLKIRGDIGEEQVCKNTIKEVIRQFGKLDILVNNAAEQHVISGLKDLTSEQLQQTFRTNFFGYVYLTRAALPHLKPGSSILNCTSIQAYHPKPSLMDYASTKAAILNFTRSLSTELAPKGIRVNAVAPGPVWTPLIPSSFPPEAMEKFGKDTPLGRPAQPCEIAPSFVFLASNADSSYISGQVIHVNGGKAMFS